jgi:Helix-turn-helix domain/Putative peptidoglycan binding domain/Lysozyme like domain
MSGNRRIAPGREGGIPVQTAGVESFAAYLRMLKHRSGRGFDRLGKQAGVSSSSLHRYCSGTSVPPDYRVVHSFAKACGASPDELRQLHRLWAIADAEREADAATGTGRQPGAESPAWPGPAPLADDEPTSDVGTGGVRTGSAGGAPGDGAPTGSLPARQPAEVLLPMTASVPIRTITTPGRGLTRWSLRARWVTAAVVAMLVVGTVAWAVVDRATGDDRPLFSSACEPLVAMGEHDDCVWEVQKLLAEAGAKLAVDGEFGPETLRRVTAFQVLAGLPARGIVDEATKKALYAGKVDMRAWSASKVEKLIRDTFPEEPAVAVAVAKCESKLDPLYLIPNTDGTRNWGVFVISDRRLTDLNGTPKQAFDPVWNVKAARALYDKRHDWKDWSHCASAVAKAKPKP